MRVWKSSAPLALRFFALTLAAVLVNPHLFIYDLLVLIPALLLVADWILTNVDDSSAAVLRLLVYLACILPLFGPLATVAACTYGWSTPLPVRSTNTFMVAPL